MKTKLVVIANDASANTKRKKLHDKCLFINVDYFIVDENIETISKAVGKK